jgi:hypothetical protein
MRSGSLDAPRTSSRRGTGVSRLLDASFGFGVWAIHLLVVYVSTAVTCQLGLGAREASLQSSVLATLIAVTLAAAAVVILHAIRRYGQHQATPEQGFLARLAVGQDAVAVLAILWQLIPLMMVPLCR